ncbi:protein RETICULATA-RELATED 1, chloroplastic isoform X2 [Herrania umbratica]|uniref:Protein RETICULATA-RELATED 1, chloroplastic isoform X2 n=1 Tax=Herrania umbratica TaxID=108875 RepID=A0A6J0ZTL3_9ROSI|nr:protein RETICULATA-RELATED 1, chloroplastic isoform X2 [Herrania umbratica]
MSISAPLIFKLSTFSGGNDSTTSKVIRIRTFFCFKEIISIESRLKLASSTSVSSHRIMFTNRRWTLHCVRPDSTGNTVSSSLEGENGDFDGESRVLEVGFDDQPNIDGGCGGDSRDGDSFGGGGGGEGDDEAEREFGPILKFEEVMKEAEARRVKLPSDMMEIAKSNGIRKLFLLRYLDLQGSVWPLGFLMKYCSMLRNRMLADPSFLFKVGTEIVIDSCCATFAEMNKRGKDFWSEFELYLADILVGVVVDIALVGMLAPYARFGQPSASRGLFGRLQHACAALPSSVFEAERPGCKFSVKQRIATYFYKGVLYGSVGFGCGLIGQGIANLIMTAKRRRSTKL